MLKIDGSYGEGGGQIVRTSLAMSLITGKDVKITDIRANRKDPGLSYQHMMAIKAAAEIGQAKTEGVEKGSSTILFEPEEVKGGSYNFDIGTAGSITLLFQALIPPAIEAQENFSIKVRGGTDVKWSPPYDYFDNIFLELLRRMGGKVDSELIKRGHYPKGGGQIKVSIEPSTLNRLEIEGGVERIEGRAFVTDLPEHIADRMKKEVLKKFMEHDTSISTDSYSSKSPGTGIVLWTSGGKVLGNGVLGEKGVPAEKVGEKAAERLEGYMRADVDLDPNAADQLIPLLVLLDGSGELTTAKMTGHLETNVWVVNRFIDEEIELIEEEEKVKIKY